MTPHELNMLYWRNSANQSYSWWCSDQAAFCKMLTPFYLFFLPAYFMQSMLIIEENSHGKTDNSTSHLVPHLFTRQLLLTSYRFSTKLQCICLYDLQQMYYLKLMSWGVRLREPLNVTILNKVEVKHQQLFIVLFGNPFVDAMESKRKKLNV